MGGRSSFGAVILALTCCGSSGSHAGGGGSSTGAAATDGSGTTEAITESENIGDVCSDAPIVVVGTYRGTLDGASNDWGEICGSVGPEVFVRVEAERRADLHVSATAPRFAPLLRATLGNCRAGMEPDQVMCADDGELVIEDLAAGASAVISVATDGHGQGSGQDFSLVFQWTPVLVLGQQCGAPGLGRCAHGMTCAAEDDGGAPTCRSLPGDTCAAPQAVAVTPGQELELVVEPGLGYADAHEHSCTGTRMADKVFRVAIPEQLAPDATLRAQTVNEQVALALRGPGCASDAELQCVAASSSGAQLQAHVGSWVASDLYLFVEWSPGHEGELAPFAIQIGLD